MVSPLIPLFSSPFPTWAGALQFFLLSWDPKPFGDAQHLLLTLLCRALALSHPNAAALGRSEASGAVILLFSEPWEALAGAARLLPSAANTAWAQLCSCRKGHGGVCTHWSTVYEKMGTF